MKIWKNHIAIDPTTAIIGLLQGILLYLLDRNLSFGAGLDALLFVTIAAPTALMLTIHRPSFLRDIGAALAVGVLFLGLIYFQPSNNHQLIIFAAPIIFALTAFYQTGRDYGFRSFTYPALFTTSTRNILILILAAIFTGLVALILGVWSSLFSLIGIDAFKRLFRHDLFIAAFYFSVFGLSVGILRNFETTITAAQRLMISTARLLAIVVATFGLSFLAALPFTGLDVLWETRNAAGLLLGMVGLFILLTTLAIEFGDTEKPFWRIGTPIVFAHLVALPIYAVLATYALALRVDQYGLTPDRILGLTVAIIALIYSFSYSASILIKRASWPKAITHLNPALALLAIALVLIVHIPGIDPVRMSIMTQMSRLETGRTPISEFDLGSFNFKYGEPGKKALAKIEANPEITKDRDAEVAFAQLQQSQNLSDWRRAENKTRQGLTGQKRDKLLTSLDNIPLFPSNVLMPERFLPALLEMAPNVARDCANGAECAMILLDFNRDGYDDTAIWNGGRILHLFIWNAPKDVYEAPIRLSTAENLTLEGLREADVEGRIRIIPARVDSLIIGEQRFD